MLKLLQFQVQHHRELIKSRIKRQLSPLKSIKGNLHPSLSKSKKKGLIKEK
jgi:hypothetical protein